ncbi:uncharacterized protein LOC128396687 [Panonychus citri]|uniref:uncharacterized protein LOC128396687 n=1 Tax=Panonychus citri TaxID=50023 RepID=UPI0023080472|nr:uncharacterized protein LOC128396687 [Panonychus citri]
MTKDIHLTSVLKRNALNFHHLIRGCLSPCGRFVFAGGEDSLVHCWNADTGEKLFTYNELPFKGPISCVEFHPLDNILAICGLNARTISVCLFNHELPKVITPKPIVGKSIQSSNMITASSSSTKQGSLNDSINSLSNHSKSDSSGKTSSRFELLRSKTIDQSNNVSESGAIRRGNFKVQRAMRRLEFALRTKSIDKR